MGKRYTIVVLMLLILTGGIARGEQSKTGKEALKLSQLLYYIDNMYVDSVNIHKLTERTIVHMLRELDPHSTYISAEDVKRANENLFGNFEGIGISYQMLNDTVIVNQTIAGCPAEKAGLLPGDRLIRIDTTAIAGVKKSINEIPKLIRGPKGSRVKITAFRPSNKETMTYNIVRDKIPIHSVDAAFYVDKGIGYIKINSFSTTTTAEMDDAISFLKRTGDLSSLIIDLQMNGGGVMSNAIEMVNRFLPADKLIVYTKGEHLRREEAKSNNTKQKLTDLPLVILTDEHSASASEIVAGALQDWDRATIIGRRTFGKGLIQRPLKLTDGSEVRLTIARYYTPSGRNIQKPYTNGAESYYSELVKRFEHGEMIHPDSINFPDSLKFTTLINKRTVYGGGGIFPDIFVPLDTNRYNHYFRKVIAGGIFNKVITDYTDQNRRMLTQKYPTFSQFYNEFEVPENTINAIHRRAEEGKIIATEKERLDCERIMRLQAKAVIAQSIFGTDYYYHIICSENDALTCAIKELSNKH